MKAKAVNTGVKTDYEIPRFGIKSSLFILASGIISGILIPWILSLVGISYQISIVIFNGVILGFGLAYSRFFIETKRGFCKKFWHTYIFFGLIFSTISFFWMYLETYI